jgi:hypothetical protein
MRVIGGSHRGPLLQYEEGATDSGNILSRGQRIVGVDEKSARNVRLRPGEMSMHHPRTVHGSRPNASPQPRINLVARYAAPSIRQDGPNPPEGILVRGTDRHGIWRLLPPGVDDDPARQRDSLRRIKENTRFVAEARANAQA